MSPMTDASSTGSHLSQLADLTARAMMLEPDAIERRRLTNLVVAHAEAFLSAVPSAPAFIPSEHVADALGAYGIPDTPRAPAEVLEVVDRLVERPGAATTSPRYAGYIPSGGGFTAALAHFLPPLSHPYSRQA